MTLAAPLLLALLLTGWSSGASIIICSRTEVSPGGETYLSFLRGAPPRLYHAVFSRERALLSCAWTDDATEVHGYESLCAGRSDGSRGPEPRAEDLREVEARCTQPDGHERSRRGATSGGHRGLRSEVNGHQRVKRGFIVPGTLWCGSGNKAPSYKDLGVFSATDSCCREHDHCKHTILSFHSQFGVFNSNIFTMSHCDCDHRFRSCLKAANDSMADMVGYTFFNLLKMQCFRFAHRLQCSQRNWFGLCKETKMALYAEVHLPTLYETPDPAGGAANATHFSVSSATVANVTESSPSDLRLFGVTPSPTRTGAVHQTTWSEKTPEPPRERTDGAEQFIHTQNQNGAERDSNVKGVQNWCVAFKHLDECEDVILPRQAKYGLYNPDPQTLYHCNCTSRLFQTVGRQRDLSPVRSVLKGHVAPSCFLPGDCSGDCPALLLETEFDSQGLGRASGSVLEEWRPPQVADLEVRRRSWRRTRKKLQRLCVNLLKRRRVLV